MDVFAELKRFIEPFDASIIEAALFGRETIFDIDGSYMPHHMGRPRSREASFDGEALLAGMQAVCFLGTQAPVNDPMRLRVPELYRKIVARLANPDLLLFGGWKEVPHGNGILRSSQYTYFCPAKLTDIGAARLLEASELPYPNAIYPWSSVFPAWRRVGTPGIAALVARAYDSPLEPGAYEMDPREAVPALVAEVQQARGLDEDAATLYLQILTLVDCADVAIREINGWTATALKKAGAQLVAAKLVNDEKQPRATRKYTLPGTWEKLFAPHPAVERWKLELYDARIKDKALAAPLGRVVPLRPIHELFQAAWDRVAARDAPESNRPTIAVGRDWIAEINASPDDDALRTVYGDWLTEQGDPRGELIALQCRRAQLARADVVDQAALDEIAAWEKALLERHGDVFAEQIHPYVEGYAYDRGLITSITVHAPTFVKHAKKLVDALPFLQELQLSTGTVGPLPLSHIVALSECEAFSRITRLDLTPDHYLASIFELEALLDAPQLPQLRWLRLGFHRGGDGFGEEGADRIAACARLTELRFLEIAGQNLELDGLRHLLEANSFKKLEMLRVPYNALKSADIEKLVDLLDDGALPALRVLDVSNVVGTGFVTAACELHRNRVDDARQQALLRVLAARRGAAAHYEGDIAKRAAPRTFTGEVLPQTGNYPFAERAKSGSSKCVACGQPITKGSVRVGIERKLDGVGRVTAWLHPACRWQAPELKDMPDLEERLTANSDVWPPAD